MDDPSEGGDGYVTLLRILTAPIHPGQAIHPGQVELNAEQSKRLARDAMRIKCAQAKVAAS